MMMHCLVLCLLICVLALNTQGFVHRGMTTTANSIMKNTAARSLPAASVFTTCKMASAASGISTISTISTILTSGVLDEDTLNALGDVQELNEALDVAIDPTNSAGGKLFTLPYDYTFTLLYTLANTETHITHNTLRINRSIDKDSVLSNHHSCPYSRWTSCCGRIWLLCVFMGSNKRLVGSCMSV